MKRSGELSTQSDLLPFQKIRRSNLSFQSLPARQKVTARKKIIVQALKKRKTESSSELAIILKANLPETFPQSISTLRRQIDQERLDRDLPYATPIQKSFHAEIKRLCKMFPEETTQFVAQRLRHKINRHLSSCWRYIKDYRNFNILP